MDDELLSQGLVSAVAAGDGPRVREFLVQGADPGACTGHLGRGILYLAAELGHTEIINLLIEAGVCPEGERQLWPAVLNGHWDAAQALLAHGAALEPYQPNCGSMLFAAFGVNPFLRLFLSLGADLNARVGPWGNTVLFDALEESPAAFALLIKAGADPNARNDEGDSVLMWAAGQGRRSAVEVLLQVGADPNVFNDQGNDEMGIASTALTQAIKHRRQYEAFTLLHAGADPRISDTSGNTPLHLAVLYLPEVVSELLAQGADAQAVDREGLTARQRAEERHRELLRLIDAT
jgi:cytohesin